MRQVDSKWASIVGEHNDPLAQAWLMEHAPSGTVGYSDDAFFTATPSERNNSLMYFGNLDTNSANRQFVQWAAAVGGAGLGGVAQGAGAGLGKAFVSGVEDVASFVWQGTGAYKLRHAIEATPKAYRTWKLIASDKATFAGVVEKRFDATLHGMADSFSSWYVNTKLDSLYGGYSGDAAVLTYAAFQVLNPEEKLSVPSKMSKAGKAAKIAELEHDADRLGKLADFKRLRHESEGAADELADVDNEADTASTERLGERTSAESDSTNQSSEEREANSSSGKGRPPKTKKQNDYTYHFDKHGRVVKVQGELKVNTEQGRNPKAQIDAGGKNRLSDDQGGHFIARVLNGPLDDFNHFAQNGNFNQGAYKSLEYEWRKLVDGGHTVRVEINVGYPKDSKRPDVLNVKYWVDGVMKKPKNFKNRRGGK